MNNEYNEDYERLASLRDLKCEMRILAQEREALLAGAGPDDDIEQVLDKAADIRIKCDELYAEYSQLLGVYAPCVGLDW